ncbi:MULTISPECIES: uroporphyrinogen-III C-methyltransferase [Kocuria]|uniref:uroporphyrinogen-III C-methyltransferase n=1 Tax=Kocuria TaxID=57493 RepID=UPI0021A79F5D|nr:MULTISPECIES: uroporphyrinogen-III C-methyltransferase [Kocuria]MCT1545862.1 uroporphyrinogen-III C-methyltransferase [Kocuria rhizophila]MCT2172377.1 uroporphyrinogen-III C-methyltransferase [Kocuria rhizophila]MDN3462222.1 uroporphyrinogen-III C-methyltransferase [Kocuria sp. APC 4018]
MTYPLGLNLTGRRVLVVGAGPVAARRVPALLAEGAAVELVAPDAHEDLRALAEDGELTWHRRGFRPDDVAGAWLVLAHTDSPAVQDLVTRTAEQHRVFCVTGGDAAASSAWVPAVARAHGVTVAVNAGGDPRRAKAATAWIAARLETGEVPVGARRPGAPGSLDAQQPGTVALVGGGPGDPGLLTVRGRYLLAGADVVVADRLGPTDLLPALAEHAEIIDVGKRAGYHKVTQDRINQTLVDQARAGHRVVRLKGGDPYVFGRGGEEVEFCHAHGIATEVVPGVTSAIAVPAAAGIPVTHRDMAHGFTVITAHEELRHVPYREGHTLILMMGVRGLAGNSATLLAAGYPADTPVAVVERGWTPTQRTTVGELATIAALAAERGVKAPAVILVGRVATLGRE